MTKKRGLSRKHKDYLIAYSFLAPNFLGYLLFTMIPVIFSLGLSFFNWTGSGEITWAGFANYQRMLKQSTFIISLKNTVFYAVANVPLTLVCSLGLALLLNKPYRGVKIYRAAFFFPYVSAVVAVAAVWNMLFHPDMGPVNTFLMNIGIKNPPRWSVSVDWVMPTVVLASTWRGMGYYMIMYLAALQNIPREQLEAAQIDGANSWQTFKKITFPMLTPTTFFVSIMLTISCFKVFDLIYNLTQGGPGRASNVLVMHIYQSAFKESRFGYASAVAVVLFLIVMVITIIQFRIEKKWVNYM